MSISAASPPPSFTYSPDVERTVTGIQLLLKADYGLSPRAVALLAVQGDEEALGWIEAQEGETVADLAREILLEAARSGVKLGVEIHNHLQDWAAGVADDSLQGVARKRTSFGHKLGQICASPITGGPILLLVLYFALYQFVGVFGGGVVVGWLEEGLFGGYINPWVTGLFEAWVPWEPIRALFVGEYGVITLGVTYAVALILPLVAFYFLTFAILEDSGYLPRLALLIDRVFKLIGLNGRAVIPIVLGFGCDTMATIVTRILETRRERVIATVLLSVAIPCAAQLAVIMSLLASRTAVSSLLGVSLSNSLLVWSGVMMLVFLLTGLLSSQITPGKPASFFLEVPPMRWPSLTNVLAKTLSRLHWYFLEVFPLFLYASVFIWGGRITGLFDAVVRATEPLVRFIGLPKEAATAFLFGFFRRDYGAAGLAKIQDSLTGAELVVACVTLTLFLPCVAQFLVVWKERGWRMAVGMGAVTLSLAFLVGATLSRILTVVRIPL